jgi:hypothetical protein
MVLKHLNNKFSSLYRMKENISLDESLTLWKGRQEFQQYIPLKTVKFRIKSFELCVSSTRYLWKFNTYSGITTPTSNVVVADSLKTCKIVVILGNHSLQENTHCGWTICQISVSF